MIVMTMAMTASVNASSLPLVTARASHTGCGLRGRLSRVRGEVRTPGRGLRSLSWRKIVRRQWQGSAVEPIPLDAFEVLVADALESIPENLRADMENVAIIVEDQ